MAAPDFLKEDNIPKSLALVEKCLSQYPNNLLFLNVKAKSFRASRDPISAATIFESISATETPWPQIRNLSFFDLGITFSINLQFEKALMCFEKLLQEHHWSKSLYSYFCAVMCDMIPGQEKEAIKYYRQIPQLVRKRMNGKPVPLEMFAVAKERQVEQQIKRIEELGLVAFKSHSYLPGLEYLYLWNGFSCMDLSTIHNSWELLKVTEEHLNESFGNPSSSGYHQSDERWYCMLLIKGVILREQGKLGESQDVFLNLLIPHSNTSSIQLNNELDVCQVFNSKNLRPLKEEVYTLAAGLYELGVLAWYQRQYDCSLKFMDQAKLVTDFPLENR
jgi:tetratricopeptide (TPR) repeat protein